MGNTKASSIVPLGSIEESRAPEAFEQPRDFHFAVTWVTLFAHLDPVQAHGPWQRPEISSPTLALVPVAAAPLTIEPPARRDSTAAWEMVVPKMIRTGSGDFAPVQSLEAGS
jgi:hypothetical protein